MTILARPSEWNLARKHPAAAPVADGAHHYLAFLSYSHRDAKLADWLHRSLESFHVPKRFVGHITDRGVVPARLTPIFRDLKELAASDDLGSEIRSALATSQYLVVLCSPGAADSRWTNAEIDQFKRVRPEGCIFAAIVGGEPFASDIPGREEEECLPRALRYKYDRRGHPTDKRAEPLAADLRGTYEERRIGFLKLVAGMLGIGLDDLIRREDVRRRRRLAILASVSLAGMVVASGLAATAIQARDEATEQRREAEGLVSFMLGDLRSKLEPIGRLDALDGVGAKVLAYYQKQDTSKLTDSSLMQRSKALSLMAGVANSRGDLDGATRLYREAMAGTSEAIRRKPSDAQRIFDHAQNVFYLGDIALRRGDRKGAEAAFREYKALSDQEVALDPNDMKWRMEAQNATANLGIMLFNERRFSEASDQLERALETISAFATADPGNRDYQKSLADSLAWVADAHLAQGRIDTAIADRERNVQLLERSLRQRPDVEFGNRLIPVHRMLGKMYAWRGAIDRAVAQGQQAAFQAEQLFAVEPGNSKWIEYAADARLDTADYFLVTGKLPEAAAAAKIGCGMAKSLFSRDASASDWRRLHRDCLRAQTNVAFASGATAEALSLAKQAVEAAKAVRSSDPIEDGYGVAKAYRLLGDIREATGDQAAARAAWSAGLAAIPNTIAERPPEMSQHQILLERLGITGVASRLANRLSAMGYRELNFRNG